MALLSNYLVELEEMKTTLPLFSALYVIGTRGLMLAKYTASKISIYLFLLVAATS